MLVSKKGSTILKEVCLVLGIAVLVFVAISTMLPDANIVGTYGNVIGTINKEVFGLTAYAYPFIFIVLAFLLYKFPKMDIRKLEIVLSCLLLFLAILMLQAIIFYSYIDLRGGFGYSVTNVLSSFIGTFGVIIIIVAFAILSLFIIFDIDFDEFVTYIKDKIFDKKNNHNSTTLKEDKNYKLIKDEFDSPSYVRRSFKKGFIGAKKDDETKSVDLNKNDNTMLDKIKLVKKEDRQETPFYIEEITDKKIPSNEDTTTKTDNSINVLEPRLKKRIEILSEVDENKKILSQIERGEVEKPKDYRLPPLSYLVDPPKKTTQINEVEIDGKISDLLEKLRRFKIDGDVVSTYAGPVVTTFEFRPAPHIKVSKILTLQDDLAMALKAQTIRIQAPIPGKDVVGIEIPNKNIDTIYLKEVLESDLFRKSSSLLTIALGKDIVGNPFVTDLKKLPHLLIAGTTGSGKSVGINAMLISLLYRNSPDTLRLMMIDPKMLEFSIYNDIPHLLTPVITQSKQAIIALSNMVGEMERRYQIMSRTKTKNIESYNEKVKKDGSAKPLPYIVIIIDELADLMMTSGKDVEIYIARLAQMARASGIHLIVATQRPSVDVVTGLIKANLPSRISYKVGQKIDSKVILDQQGAESLLGRGDMLFTPPGMSGVIRLHAPFTSEKEIEHLVEYLKDQRATEYDESFLKDSNESSSSYSGSSDYSDDEIDELFEDAKRIVLSEQKTSISYIQRRLQIGYNRAARIIEQLENMGILSSPNSKGQREIL